MRRLRRFKIIQETQLKKDDFVYPLFIDENIKKRKEIASIPGQYRFPLKEIVEEVTSLREIGIRSVILFGIPSKKNMVGSEAYNKNGVVQRAIKAIKKEITDIIVIGDVCLCEYTSHGHCGILTEENYIDNDKTLDVIGKIAESYAESGIDIVAPSGMMDGTVRFVRKRLDDEGYTDVAIMAYSAKYNSGFYSPFRDAADSSPSFGDRSTYQMDYKNSDEAMREIYLDIKEGADIVMVKPALSYLDIIYRAKKMFNFPLAAYNVSGEYAMLKLSSLDQDRVMEEILSSIKRAGADIIISYHAKEFIERFL
ncbi:MAG: porphobilinogen synthase [Candidatus Methanoliparum thermophilum]|uniref:Delta-aminolevulinic acid dehydratase n=2 Tax=Candidatus Methanoliparum TaxID=2545692 RepID=A0A520KSB1_METT2|nr:MAG: porphobilinogen synthase [Candidatus Methanoliparum thermophilum]